ncbi:MAG: methylmalonyl Co-A mutase-associated GTPase MeaB [Fluviicola sp.]
MDEQHKADWLKKRKEMRDLRRAEPLFAGIRSKSRSHLSAAITLLESTLPADMEEAQKLINLCLPYSGNSLRIGITGVPGVGKSSFIEVFGQTVIAEGKRLAVLAIDPSSERSGGSILGDKTRMEHLSQKDEVFIRPTAAGSTLGGVARKTRETIILCEAAGFDVLFIETVGVGQSEIMVHSMVDFFLLLLLAGAGDELQGIKRGIMEMADGLAVTKADGDNVKRAQLAAREIKNAIHLFPPTENGWIPEVKSCSSLEKSGISEIWEMIERFERHTQTNGSFDHKRHNQDLYWMEEALKEKLIFGLHRDPEVKAHKKTIEAQLLAGEISAFEAADRLYQLYKK